MTMFHEPGIENPKPLDNEEIMCFQFMYTFSTVQFSFSFKILPIMSQQHFSFLVTVELNMFNS